MSMLQAIPALPVRDVARSVECYRDTLESAIAGAASCRVAVPGVDEPPRVLSPLGILHAKAPLRDRWYGTREFGAPRSRPRRGGLF